MNKKRKRREKTMLRENGKKKRKRKSWVQDEIHDPLILLFLSKERMGEEKRGGGELFQVLILVLFISHSWLTTSSVHLPQLAFPVSLSVLILCASLPLTLICPSFLAFLLSYKEHHLFVHTPKCLQHPVLYLQSMWDEMCVFVCVCARAHVFAYVRVSFVLV